MSQLMLKTPQDSNESKINICISDSFPKFFKGIFRIAAKKKSFCEFVCQNFTFKGQGKPWVKISTLNLSRKSHIIINGWGGRNSETTESGVPSLPQISVLPHLFLSLFSELNHLSTRDQMSNVGKAARVYISFSL